MKFSLPSFLRSKKRSHSLEKALSNTASGDFGFLTHRDSLNPAFNISPEAGQKLAVAYSCIRNISEDISKLPIELWRRTSDGDRERVFNSTSNLLSKRPNINTNNVDYGITLLNNTLSSGNGYALITRNESTAQPTAITNLDYRDVTARLFNGRVWYQVKGIEGFISNEDLIHIKAMSQNGFTGVSPIREHSLSVGNGLEAVKYEKEFFQNGGFIKGYVKLQGKLEKGRDIELSNQWDAKFGTGKTPFLQNGAEFTPVNLPQKDAEYIATRKLTKEDVAGIYRMPLGKLSVFENTTQNNSDQQDIEYVKYTLDSYIIKLEQEYNEKLLTEAEKNTHFWEINVNALLRGDIEKRMKATKDLFETGSITSNEIRLREGFNKRDGGDSYYTPVNLETTRQEDLRADKTEAEIKVIKDGE